MKKLINIVNILIIVIGITFTSCTKDESPSGVPTVLNKSIDFSGVNVQQYNVRYGIYTDVDNNVYKTLICKYNIYKDTVITDSIELEFMLENLRVTRLSDSTVIPNIKDSATWVTTTEKGMCNYNNTTNLDSIKVFGSLYNGYVVTNKSLPNKGWLPFDFKWLEAMWFSFDKYTETWGAKVKEKGNAHWLNNSLSNNSFGLTLVGSGLRTDSAKYVAINQACYIWNSVKGKAFAVQDNLDSFETSNPKLYKEHFGFSIRLYRKKSLKK